MKLIYNFLLLLMLYIGTASCITNPGIDTEVKKVVIIRHGEKPDKGDNLSCQGFNRAIQLSNVLYAKIGVPDHIFVPTPNFGKATSVARMYQTVVPFAVKYNLDIDTKYDVKDAKGVADAILKKSGIVLLVWEHKAAKHIAKALGVNGTDLEWDDNDFDSMWVISFSNGRATLTKDKENIRPAAQCP